MKEPESKDSKIVMERIFGNLPAFVINGVAQADQRSVWEKWRRAFIICCNAVGIKDASSKKNLLLGYGGMELHEIFYGIPGADVEASLDVDPFEIAMQKLDEYFSPKRHESHERYIFHTLSPKPEEQLDKFIMRLQTQAKKCQFGTTQLESQEIAVIDQALLVAPKELREKLLQEKNLTLDALLLKVNAFQRARNTSEQMAKPSTSTNEFINKLNESQRKCYACGLTHNRDQNCPALGRTCGCCGLKNHFRAMCRTKNPEQTQNRGEKRSSERPAQTNQFNRQQSEKQKQGEKRSFEKGAHSNSFEQRKRSRIHEIDSYEKDTEVPIDMVTDNGESGELILAQISGTTIQMQIDSGASCNVIDNKTWDLMKNQSQELGKLRPADKKFKAYAQKDSLTTLGMFDAKIAINDNGKVLETTARFYVIADGPQPLLGRKTAQELGVLVLGLPSLRNIQQVHEVRPADKLPVFKGLKAKIIMNRSVAPVIQKLQRLPLAVLPKVERKLEELLARGVIEKVDEPSQWVSPMVVVLKDSGEIRLCLDMRRVNEAVKRETHPLPTLEDMRTKLRGAKYFTRLDLKDAFHQLELDEESKKVTTFITHRGMFRYTRLLFGLSCAPEIFQKMLEMILSGCENVINFIDDIIVYGSTLEEHDRCLTKVLQTLKRYDVLLNSEKCAFRLQEIDFLGHQFSADGMKPANDKLSSIMSYRAPQTKAEVRSFLGLVGYIGQFIPNLATLTFPLREVSKKDAMFKWTESAQKAFDDLKRQVSSIETLSHFDSSLRTRVIADASPVGLGAVLVQFKDEQKRVVAFASKALSVTEQKYHQTEKEALALVWGVERFSNYLIGRKFELETDHKPLVTLFKPCSRPCMRIERWVLRLQAFDFIVIYRKGSENIADPFSRLLPLDNEPSFDSEGDVCIKNIAELVAIDLKEIETATDKDEELKELRDCLVTGNWNFKSENLKPYLPFREEFGSVQGLVVRGDRLIIPRALRSQVLQLGHEGHPGQTLMTKRLRYVCWWPKMDAEIKDLVRTCHGCLTVSRPDPAEPMKRRELPKAPWVAVAIDFMGPLPSQEYLLVIVDYFSRYKEVKIMKNITAKDTIDRLEEIFIRLGFPQSITLDNGRQFASKESEDYCQSRGIKLIFSTPYWPSENGEVERQNRSLLKRLKISQSLKRNWKQDLQAYLMMYYTTPHSTTGKTPSELLFGRTIRTKLPRLSEVAESRPNADYIDEDMAKKFRGKEIEDLKRKSKASDIQSGDEVLMKNVIPGNKLTPTFGPARLRVIDKKNARVTVEDELTGNVYQRNSSHFKKFPLSILPTGTLEMDSRNRDHDASGKKSGDLSKEDSTSAPVATKCPVTKETETMDTTSIATSRNRRTARLPSRYKDSVLYGLEDN